MPITPDTSAPIPEDRVHVAGQLRDQAHSCAAMGSPLYAELLGRAAQDVLSGGPVWAVLAGHVRPGRGDALALRFMAAVHRLVLTGAAPALAGCYPSTGGAATPEQTWEHFAATVEEHADALAALVSLPCQTNEVGRCAGLIGGFLRMAANSGRPLRVLEVGASAGLNLRWDRYRYGGGGAAWGPEDSPVDLNGHWSTVPPHVDRRVEVVHRRGCDPDPVDPLSDEGKLTLTAAVWADQPERHERLRGALEVAAAVPAEVDRASVHEWLPGALADLPADAATVVFHSIVEEYLSTDARARFHSTLQEAAKQATRGAPLAWLRMEPVSMLRAHGVTMTTWPGGRQRLLATCGAHGTDVVWRR